MDTAEGATMRDGLMTAEELGLSTDLYELTMAAAFFEAGLQERTATFDVAVRSLPATRGYLLAAGLEQALAYLEALTFDGPVIDWLASTGHFRPPFLEFLRELSFTGEVAAVPEGSVYFPPGPLLRVTAPIIEAQIVETYLLTTITFQTMIASKAARVVEAAAGRSVVDFSPRRDHGPQAGLLAARAAYIGGCTGTSNVLAERHFGIPSQGTMAHSFVMFGGREIESYRTFARAYPGNPVLLIDTYDTVQGARLAAQVDAELRPEGRRVAAVRLDSGDLVALSRQVRAVLDEAGCEGTHIVASGNLDEYEIARLLQAGACIDSFGVGTELGTSGDAPSLNSTYKLAARTEVDGAEVPVIKLSANKVSLPGRKQTWRRSDSDGTFAADVVALHHERLDGEPQLHVVMRDGNAASPLPSLSAIRDRAAAQRRRLPAAVRELRDPAPYPVSLSAELEELIERLRRTEPRFVGGRRDG